jgi:hypothetical protein
MSSHSAFDTRNDPPSTEPIFHAAIVFVVAVLAIITLIVAAS